MLNETLVELLEYLTALSKVQGSGHYVNDEIKEAVKAIRIELGLDKKKNDNVKSSRFLVFEAKLGKKATFEQAMLFEAVYDFKGTAEVLFEYSKKNDMEKAIEVLQGMKPSKKMRLNEEVELCSITVF